LKSCDLFLPKISGVFLQKRTLAELGYNIIDTERGLEEGLLAEGTLRNWINKYESSTSEDVYSHEFIDAYNQYAQKQILPALNVRPNIHILDCSGIEVQLNNGNYEHSAVIKDQDGPRRVAGGCATQAQVRGYKTGTLRGIMKDTGLLEEIKLGPIKTHDLELCRDMLLTSESLKPGEIRINDRGFLSRTLINTLKTTHGVDMMFL
jgi:hypothetical protein